ncbi:ATP-binding cassette domain-containing protein [Pseudonocardia kunmingensis]|uniref:Peptide/nickel transport system ATP-binding protein n=1 Tax=Pseudonocardia kunmingensis TaxID=630975 RepID=A0A543DP52_9PSEU|nr:ABC transporter ATP-binding protein [Pseudonocardia kunmingensis]TQM11116.1 peptide/nickel transport system ATP-binding protein [Pseudonocardia kunmingensis]
MSERASNSSTPGVPLLELRVVTRRYTRRRDGVTAVDGVSLTLAAGEILALVGASGAGKSTLSRLVLGLERPDRGAVLLDGVDIARLRGRALRAERRRMHLVLQDPYDALHPGMRIAEVVGEPLAIAGVASAERGPRVASALEEVGLGPAERFLGRHPHQLSGGQRQRVAIARAIVGQPRLIVADEPTSMVDASLRATILELLLATRERLGTGFVFITHDLALARYVADRIAVMQAGRIVEVGPAEELVADPQRPYTRELLDASERVRIN